MPPQWFHTRTPDLTFRTENDVVLHFVLNGILLSVYWISILHLHHQHVSQSKVIWSYDTTDPFSFFLTSSPQFCINLNLCSFMPVSFHCFTLDYFAFCVFIYHDIQTYKRGEYKRNIFINKSPQFILWPNHKPNFMVYFSVVIPFHLSVRMYSHDLFSVPLTHESCLI